MAAAELSSAAPLFQAPSDLFPYHGSFSDISSDISSFLSIQPPFGRIFGVSSQIRVYYSLYSVTLGMTTTSANSYLMLSF